MPLDPYAKRFLDRLAALSPPSALSLSVGDRRVALRHLLGFSGRLDEVAQIENLEILGPAGPLAARSYTPFAVGSDIVPGIVFFHGGGLVAGGLDSHEAICRSLANASGCRVIAVDYRLAPEFPFPAGIADGYEAVGYVASHAAKFGIDPDRLVVCGDSAGATLAAVVCQMAASNGRPQLALQVLLCPILDFSAETDSRRSFAEGYLMDRATLEHDLKHYLGPGDNPADPRISPLRAEWLGSLPPTCIHTAEFDPLRDEGQAYAERLKAAGVRTIYRCHSGMIHLFYGMSLLIPYAATAYKSIGADIRAMLR
jgi:acetyl esterase/lipase